MITDQQLSDMGDTEFSRLYQSVVSEFRRRESRLSMTAEERTMPKWEAIRAIRNRLNLNLMMANAAVYESSLKQ